MAASNIASRAVALVLLLIFHPGGSVMVYVEVPRLVVAGWSALLRCQFDLEGEKLYSVKWYTSNLEFFRYTPDRSPSTVAFPVPGLNVDLSGSNMNEVRLRNVATNMSALFFCEVSADGPTFHTATESAFLNVSDISIRKPQLLISSSVYSRDMYINCSAQETDPPPKVTFFLDEQPVDKRGMMRVRGSVWSVKLDAVVKHVEARQSYADSPVWIRCEASLQPSVYHLTSASVPILVHRQFRNAGSSCYSFNRLEAPFALVAMGGYLLPTFVYG